MANESGKKPAIRTTKKHIARLERERQQSRAILYAFIGILAAVVLLLIYGYLDIKYFQLQRPVAKVGETEILASKFEPRVRLQRQQLLAQYNQYSQYAQLFGMDVQTQLQQIQAQLDSPTSIGQSVMDQLVNEELIRQEAKKRGISVSEEELQEAMQDAFGYFPNGSPTPSPTATALTLPEIPAEALAIVSLTPIPSATSEVTATPEVPATLESTATVALVTTGTPGTEVSVAPSSTPTTVPSATTTATLEPTAEPTSNVTSTPLPTSTPYTLEGFQSEFNDARGSLLKLGFKEADYNDLFETQLLEKKLKDEITADVPHVEKQVWARHILVSDVATAMTIIERLKNGEDFATLAKELSIDGSAQTGGDLGWFGSGAMVAEFETAAFALEKSGDFTQEPVQTQFGYHVIQLIAKQDRPLTQEQYDAAKTKAFQDWLTAAREEYGVETFDDVWQAHIPTEPNFTTMATDSANAQKTALAEEKANATDEATATP
jgi:parvulin-like peptidyl-prolyl isomerase